MSSNNLLILPLLIVLTALTLAGCASESPLQPGTLPTLTASSPGSQSETENEIEPSQSIQPIEQEVFFSISGGCLESFELFSVYSIFEEYQDDCVLTVEVYPALPLRGVQLQFEEAGWITEQYSQTDSSGFAYLYVDPYCDDGLWCDGTWNYRVFVEAAGPMPEESSEVFELEFVAF